ncbi:hypothetical protein V2G26_011940 [Clonostachys chloroleuca]
MEASKFGTRQQDYFKKTLESEGKVVLVTFSSGSELITARSSDGTIKIWNTETGRLQRTLQGNSDGNDFVSITFSLASSNSGLIASVSYNGIFEIWDASRGSFENHGRAMKNLS